MRSVSAVALLSGPIVLIAYVVGSLTATWLRVGDKEQPSDALIEAFVALASATAAWWTIQELAPGSRFSRIGYLSDQVLAVWHSVAVWAGLAVVAGICAPLFRRFRGGSGLAPTGALLAAHFPWFLFATGGAWLATLALLRDTRSARVLAIAMLLPTAWLGWVLEWHPAWGLAPGPEATVWSMVVTMVLGVRWWADRDIGTDGVGFD